LIQQAQAIEFIAHRGESAHHKENTVMALKAAIDSKFNYVEIDVQKSKDDQVIVIHDDSIDRTTSSKGLVSEHTLKELKFIDPTIPTLSEVLELFKKTKTPLIIEVKNSGDINEGIEKIIVKQVKDSGIKNIIYKSFTKKVLDRFRELDDKKLIYVAIGDLPLGLYVDDWLRFGTIFDYKDVDFYQVHRRLVNKNTKVKAHKNGAKLIAWDVQNISEVKEMIKLGADIIETDYPPANFTENPSFSK
jgi:glycerophosphoryl diester phosphodiesterase